MVKPIYAGHNGCSAAKPLRSSRGSPVNFLLPFRGSPLNSLRPSRCSPVNGVQSSLFVFFRKVKYELIVGTLSGVKSSKDLLHETLGFFRETFGDLQMNVASFNNIQEAL